MNIKIKTATYIAGDPVAVGEIIEIDENTGKYLIQLGRAEVCAEAPESLKEEVPPKPVFARKGKDEGKDGK